MNSIGKPLPGRTNIVLTRDLSLQVPGGVLAGSLDAALAYARKDAAQRGVDEIMVIGGGDVFADTLPLADRLDITHVHAAPDGDAFFPPIDSADWREVARKDYPAGPDDEVGFHCGGIFKALNPRANAACGRVVTRRSVPYNPPDKRQPTPTPAPGDHIHAMDQSGRRGRPVGRRR